MNANEAPEKFYFLPNGFISYFRNTDEDIEYTSTDAVIEKACEWLSNVSLEDMTYKYDGFDTSEGWYKFIEDFRKYMSL